MSEEKPKNFKGAALSHIPPGFLESMQKQVAVNEEDMKRLHDKVVKHGPALHANPTSIVPKLTSGEQLPQETTPVPVPQPPQPATMSYAIDGHVINVPKEDVGAAIMMFYTLVALVWSKDKHVAKILKQFNFKFFDANQNQIYPPVKNGKDKK